MSRAEDAVRYVRERASGAPLDRSLRLTVHFHPDRRCGGTTVLEALVRDGVYSSQFVTGTSNGGLTAHPGGDRWRWESRLFGGVYDGAPAAERPVYGALDNRRRRNGGSPRFGSAYLELGAAVLDRATFCYPDSADGPVDVGTADRAGLIETAESGSRDLLDDYVEAQVHGGVDIERDVAAVVLDPSHRGTAVERAARLLPCEVRWHAGFVLTVDEVRARPGFRPPAAVELAELLAVDGVLTPRVVGAAAVGGADPQTVKYVWHYLARFGRPADPALPGPAIALH